MYLVQLAVAPPIPSSRSVVYYVTIDRYFLSECRDLCNTAEGAAQVCFINNEGLERPIYPVSYLELNIPICHTFDRNNWLLLKHHSTHLKIIFSSN